MVRLREWNFSKVDLYRNTECDYSSAYITLLTDTDLVGHGMTFTIGRGNDIVGPFPLISCQTPANKRLKGLHCYQGGCQQARRQGH